jgi:hypothetical protein
MHSYYYKITEVLTMLHELQPAYTVEGDVWTINNDSAWRTGFRGRQDIRGVVIMAGVTTIGRQAFQG